MPDVSRTRIRPLQLVGAFVLCFCALSVVMIGLGWLVTRELVHVWPLSIEDGADRYLAGHRDGLWNGVTGTLSTIADTIGASLLTLLVVLLARLRFGRWRESLFVAFSVLLELTVFLVTTVAIHRHRPAVHELDVSPPTSSFPSGHTAAAVALYGAVAVLFYVSTRRRASWLFLLMPVAVGGARLYRGMHHPSDVVAGALLGTMALWAAWRMVLGSGHDDAESAPSLRAHAAPVKLSGGAVLIANGVRVDAEAAERLLGAFTEHCSPAGRPAPRLELTTPEDHGAGLARAAVASGAGLVVACGGDGTVNEVAGALLGTGVPLGVIPMGTGNLLATNLGIPTAVDDAIAVLATEAGMDRQIDVGRIDGRTTFLGMAGLGLDAAMIEAAPETLKKRAGWAAYVVALGRHLADRISTVTVEVDGRRSRHRDVSMLLVGNIGRIQAGLKPMPDAEVDDGLLDLVVLAPDGPLGWLRAAAVMKSSKNRADQQSPAGRGREVFRDRGRRITVHTPRPVPREADGETLAPSAGMQVEVWPGALTVRVPKARIPSPDSTASKASLASAASSTPNASKASKASAAGESRPGSARERAAGGRKTESEVLR